MAMLNNQMLISFESEGVRIQPKGDPHKMSGKQQVSKFPTTSVFRQKNNYRREKSACFL